MRLIGRTPELRHLTASIERVREGHATVTTIEGEPGIGKTKLLTELRSRVTAEGWHVLDCRCDALDVERPFVALIDALDELCEELGPDAPDELTEVNALLRRMTLGSGPPTSEHATSTPAQSCLTCLRANAVETVYHGNQLFVDRRHSRGTAGGQGRRGTQSQAITHASSLGNTPLPPPSS